MKTIPSGLASSANSKFTTFATALKITRPDGTIFGFTSSDKDQEFSGVNYLANPGLDLTGISIAASASVGNLELSTLHDGTIFTDAQILGGVWRNSKFVVFRYDWETPSHGIDTLLSGVFGECTIKQNSVVIELRDWRQFLQQTVGDASSKTCRARLGDVRCKKDLTSFTYTGTLTSVTSSQVFTDTSRVEAAAWFDEGEITFTSGQNSGLGIVSKIKTFETGGKFTLALPLYGIVAIGNTYSVIAGCRKRLQEDCRDKFDNVLNFVGEPHRPGIDVVTQSPTASI